MAMAPEHEHEDDTGMTAEAAEAVNDRADDDRLETPSVNTPTPDEDERLRGLIRAELDRQHAMPIARRTLELLAEAEAEPMRAEPGYRVIDRNGETRLLHDGDADPDEEANDVSAPLTLRDLVAELRERHPELFATPPEPEAADPVPPPPPEPAHDTLADVKAAGARFVETQSALAKTFAASSAQRGRAFATAASGRFEGWRSRRGERRKAPAPPLAVPSASGSPEEPVADMPVTIVSSHSDGGMTSRDTRRRFVETVRAGGSQVAGFLGRRREGLSAIPLGEVVTPPRAVFAGLVAATVLAIAVAVVNGRREAATTPSTSPPPTVEAPRVPEARKEPVPSETPRPASPDAAPEDAEAGPSEEAPRNPNDIAGVPQVIDTSTLKLSGKVIHLFGVEWVRGGQADELTKYLRGREVTCRPAVGSSAFLCSVEGRDLSEVVLFNGGGRASSEASPDLVAAEDHARSERLGVWKR